MCAARCRWRARRDPNSGDSQFFICFDDATFLDSQYTAWGKVIEGMENVDKIKRGEPVNATRQDHQGDDGGRRELVIPGRTPKRVDARLPRAMAWEPGIQTRVPSVHLDSGFSASPRPE